MISTIAESFTEFTDESTPAATLKELGDRITATVAQNPTALLYVGRSLVEGDEAGLGMFDAFVDIALTQLRRLDRRRELRSAVDLEWAAMHLVIFNLGTVLFEAAVSRRLSQPFFDAGELERWNTASTELFKRGLLRPAAIRRGR